MIRVVNLRDYVLKENEVLIKIDRSSVLGNPFVMNNESERDLVCNKYKEYMDNIFKKNLYQPSELSNREKDYITEFRRIIKIARSGKDIAFGCWCYPKRCHGNDIKFYFDKYL